MSCIGSFLTVKGEKWWCEIFYLDRPKGEYALLNNVCLVWKHSLVSNNHGPPLTPFDKANSDTTFSLSNIEKCMWNEESLKSTKSLANKQSYYESRSKFIYIFRAYADAKLE